MRLVSPTLSIALLSCERLAGASARYQRYDSSPTNGGRRGLQYGGVGGAGNRSDRAGGSGSDRGPGHSAAMDRNDNGIDLDAAEYTYGDAVAGSFEVTNDKVSMEVLADLDMSRTKEWTIGVFMRMQRPVPGEDPIVSIVPSSISGVDGAAAKVSVGSLMEKPKRALQAVQEVMAADAVDAEAEAAALDMAAAPDLANLEIPDLHLSGGFTIPGRSTVADVLDENVYGTGFDVYLLDGEGRDIIGPATFYTKPTEDMQQAEAAAYAKFSMNLARDHSNKKHIHKVSTKGNAKGKGPATGMGIAGAKGIPLVNAEGAGKGGAAPAPILAAEPLMGDYLLETDKEYYDLGEKVVVTYDLSADTGHRLVRMLQGFKQKRAGGFGGRGGSKNKIGKGGGKRKNKGGGKGGNKGDNEDLPIVDPTPPDVDPTPPDVDEITTTLAPPTDPPEVPYDGPDPDDMDDMDGGFIGEAFEDPDEVDLDDVTLFRVGVFMRMAHPQGGSLAPIVDVGLCSSDDCFPEDASMGSVEINTDDLNAGSVNGLGFAVWILNGAGGEVAGPFDFYINADSIR